MPNPYIGNDDAARYVDYYASSRMQRDSVRRLYTCGLRRRQEAQRRAEAAVYPPQPRTYRTRKEMDDYVNAMVYSEVFRRQKKLAELEWELYHAAPARHLSEDDMQRHVQHMYDQQVRKRERRAREMQERFGMQTLNEREAREREKCRELEENWKPPSAYIKHDDGRMLLVAELAAINTSPNSPAAREKRETHVNRHADPKRLQLLAKPLRVTPKVQKESDGDALMPPFRLFGDAVRTRGRK